MYSLPNIIGLIKLGRWATNMVCVRAVRNEYKIFVEELSEYSLQVKQNGHWIL
jgi:hypothetical protein